MGQCLQDTWKNTCPHRGYIMLQQMANLNKNHRHLQKGWWKDSRLKCLECTLGLEKALKFEQKSPNHPTDLEELVYTRPRTNK